MRPLAEQMKLTSWDVNASISRKFQLATATKKRVVEEVLEGVAIWKSLAENPCLQLPPGFELSFFFNFIPTSDDTYVFNKIKLVC